MRAFSTLLVASSMMGCIDAWHSPMTALRYRSMRPVSREPRMPRVLSMSSAFSQGDEFGGINTLPRHGFGPKTKVIATLGPASSSAEMIKKLALAGVDVFRLNFSHGSKESHAANLKIIRDLEVELKRPLGVLLDLQGPKLRVGQFGGPGKFMLEKGQRFRLDMSPELGDQNRVQLNHPEIMEAMTPGKRLLVNDGNIALVAVETGPDYIVTEVEIGGVISDRKGVNVPDVVLPIPALTEADKRNALYGLELDVDWMALSFVQRPEDIYELRDIVGRDVAIIAKLEKPSAVSEMYLTGIIEAADGCMVARGDLGVECPAESVPILQRKIIGECRKRGKPVVVATQMLESMITNAVPTRAEASDVATACYLGTDAVMLSGESAAGEYPVESVAMMRSIITAVESDPRYYSQGSAHKLLLNDEGILPERAMTMAARQIARSVDAAAIVVYTRNGLSALRAAQERSSRPILALSSEISTARKLAMVYGCTPFSVGDGVETESDLVDLISSARGIIVEKEFASSKQLLVVTAWMDGGSWNHGANAVRIVRVGNKGDAKISSGGMATSTAPTTPPITSPTTPPTDTRGPGVTMSHEEYMQQRVSAIRQREAGGN
mmetsp:Transcript_13832/g.18392  ORF Transcript_13832/g.18392 Transcript_13832/m.18392 type:complete len:609 (-) Transcript_13832:352-2178(-)